MKVFITWSGSRSKLFAKGLAEFLPQVIQSVKPWMSESDIDPGARWNEGIADQLEKSSLGILCITRENMNAPWLLFEAGALSKPVQESRVVPYLLDIPKSDLTYPLAQFQAKIVNKDDTLEIVRMINRRNADQAIDETILSQAFEAFWTHFEQRIEEAKRFNPVPDEKPSRTQEEVFEEMLQHMRLSTERGRQISDAIDRIESLSTRIAAREAYRVELTDTSRRLAELGPPPTPLLSPKEFLEQSRIISEMQKEGKRKFAEAIKERRKMRVEALADDKEADQEKDPQGGQ